MKNAWPESVRKVFRNAYRAFIEHDVSTKRIEYKRLLVFLEPYGVADYFTRAVIGPRRGWKFSLIVYNAWKGILCTHCHQRFPDVWKTNPYCSECLKDEHVHNSRRAEVKKVTTDRMHECFSDPLKVKTIVEKRRSTCLARYGVDNPTKNAEIRNIAAQRIREALQDPAVVKKRRKTCLRKYGVSNPQQSSLIRAKTVRSQYRTREVTVGGKTFYTQGYEHIVLQKLSEKMGEQNVARYVVGGGDKQLPAIPLTSGVYFPDFYHKRTKQYIEVKSLWTLTEGSWKNAWENCTRKAREASESGYQVLTLVVHRGRIVRLPDDWCYRTKSEVKKLVNAE